MLHLIEPGFWVEVEVAEHGKPNPSPTSDALSILRLCVCVSFFARRLPLPCLVLFVASLDNFNLPAAIMCFFALACHSFYVSNLLGLPRARPGILVKNALRCWSTATAHFSLARISSSKLALVLPHPPTWDLQGGGDQRKGINFGVGHRSTFELGFRNLSSDYLELLFAPISEILPHLQFTAGMRRISLWDHQGPHNSLGPVERCLFHCHQHGSGRVAHQP